MRKKWMRQVSTLLVLTMILSSAASVSATTTEGAATEDAATEVTNEVSAISNTDNAEPAAQGTDSETKSHDSAETPVDNTTATDLGETGTTTDNTVNAETQSGNSTSTNTDNSTSAGTDDSISNGTDSSTSTNTNTETTNKDISGTVTVDEENADVSGTVNVDEDKHDDNVEIKKNDKPYLALGADLSAEQQATVLSLMGIDGSRLSDYDVVYINNSEEHQYLDSYIDSSKIGTKSLSSVVIVERKDGNGINISTNNISYCTVGMYKNALATAGIENADIIVAGPFPISGTAALVGIFKAYTEMTGNTLDEENIDAALHELVVTGALEESTGVDADEIEGLMAYVKQAVVEHDISNESEIREAIAEGCDKFDVTLTEDEINEIVQLMLKISDLNLDIDTLLNSAQSIYERIGSDSGFWTKFMNMLNDLLDKLKVLFG